MKTSWLCWLGCGMLLVAGPSFASDANQAQKKQNRNQIQAENTHQEPQGATIQTRNRIRNRNQTGEQSKQQLMQQTRTQTRRQDAKQSQTLKSQLQDGLADRLQKKSGLSHNQEEVGQNNMKRGRHRNRQQVQVGAGTGQGTMGRNRLGKGFGESFVDSDGDGVCDHHQRRAKQSAKSGGSRQKKNP